MSKILNDFVLPSLDFYEPPDFSIKPVGLPDMGEENNVCVSCSGDNGVCFWCKPKEEKK